MRLDDDGEDEVEQEGVADEHKGGEEEDDRTALRVLPHHDIGEIRCRQADEETPRGLAEPTARRADAAKEDHGGLSEADHEEYEHEEDSSHLWQRASDEVELREQGRRLQHEEQQSQERSHARHIGSPKARRRANGLNDSQRDYDQVDEFDSRPQHNRGALRSGRADGIEEDDSEQQQLAPSRDKWREERQTTDRI